MMTLNERNEASPMIESIILYKMGLNLIQIKSNCQHSLGAKLRDNCQFFFIKRDEILQTF